MNRLTMKISNANNFCKYELKNAKYRYLFDLTSNKQIEDYVDANLTIAIDKLGQLEDIEEELGIDLIKAVELCKQVNNKKVVYTKENWGIVPLKILDELELELFSHRLYVNARGMYVSLDLYEYKKTWALTEEELENE